MAALEAILKIRKFNRFYTHFMGLLKRGILDSDYSLLEGRVIYELANTKGLTAKDLCKMLDADAGQISRLLKGFEKKGMIMRTKCPADARRVIIALSEYGQAEADRLADLSNQDLENKLSAKSDQDVAEVVSAMDQITDRLSDEKSMQGAVIIRPFKGGDMGWVLEQHAVLYADGYGWTKGFETLTARIIADFLEGFDPKCEQAFIAEHNGRRVGSIFLVKDEADHTARIRLFLMDPVARGLGIGKMLVQTAVDFARGADYSRISLWTNAVLTTARHIYEKAGFTLVKEEMHTLFGPPMMGHTFEMDL